MSEPISLFRGLPTLETARLVLRKMRLSDDQDMFVYAADARVAEHVSWYPHTSIDQSRAFLRATVDCYERGAVAGWAITLRGDDRLVGTAGFMVWDAASHRAEIGYSLASHLWGQGLMTEAARAIVRFGFEVGDLNRVEARCKPVNVGSARVMEKVGMRFEGLLREHQLSKGVYEDLKLYAMLRRDWEEARVAG